MAESSEPEQPVDFGEGVQFFYELARWQLDEQIGRIDALDRKLAATFTLNGALIAIFAAAFTLRDGELTPVLWSIIVFVVAVFVANAFCTFMAYRLRRWKIGPELSDFLALAEQEETDVVKYVVAAQIKTAIEDNENLLLEKARWTRLATVFTTVDLCAVAVAALAITWPWCWCG